MFPSPYSTLGIEAPNEIRYQMEGGEANFRIDIDLPFSRSNDMVTVKLSSNNNSVVTEMSVMIPLYVLSSVLTRVEELRKEKQCQPKSRKKTKKR